jgi:hypothetical protein
MEKLYDWIDQNELKDQKFIEWLKNLNKNQKIDLAWKVEAWVADSVKNIISSITEEINSKWLNNKSDFIDKTLLLINSLSNEQKANLKLMIAVWEIKRLNNVDWVNIDLSNLNFVESDLKNILWLSHTFWFDISKEKRIDWWDNAKSWSVLDDCKKKWIDLNAWVSFDIIYNKINKIINPNFDTSIIWNRVILRDDNWKDLWIRLKQWDPVQLINWANFIPIQHDWRKDYYLTVKIPWKDWTFKVSANFIKMPNLEEISNKEKDWKKEWGTDKPKEKEFWKCANPAQVKEFIYNFPDLNATDKEVEDAAYSVYWNKENGFNNLDEAWKNPKFLELIKSCILKNRNILKWDTDKPKEKVDNLEWKVINIYDRVRAVLKNIPTNDEIDGIKNLDYEKEWFKKINSEKEIRELIWKQIDKIIENKSNNIILFVNLVDVAYVNTKINWKHINDIIKEVAKEKWYKNLK